MENNVAQDYYEFGIETDICHQSLPKTHVFKNLECLKSMISLHCYPEFQFFSSGNKYIKNSDFHVYYSEINKIVIRANKKKRKLLKILETCPDIPFRIKIFFLLFLNNVDENDKSYYYKINKKENFFVLLLNVSKAVVLFIFYVLFGGIFLIVLFKISCFLICNSLMTYESKWISEKYFQLKEKYPQLEKTAIEECIFNELIEVEKNMHKQKNLKTLVIFYRCSNETEHYYFGNNLATILTFRYDRIVIRIYDDNNLTKKLQYFPSGPLKKNEKIICSFKESVISLVESIDIDQSRSCQVV
jgi:hypothetical protein